MTNAWMLLVLCAACGPTISENRITFLPAREQNCQLEFIQDKPWETNAWEVIGIVSIAPSGADPLSSSNKAIVRSRACSMGGEAVGIAAAGSAMNMVASATGSSYYVLHRPIAKTEAKLF